MEEAALEGLFDSPQATDVSTFIARYSSINITTNSRFALAWARVQAGESEELGGLAPRGNSRDDATPFEYGCTKTQECPYRATQLSNLLRHERVCSFKKIELTQKMSAKKLIPCTYANCGAMFVEKRHMLAHVATVHDWKPRECPEDDCPDHPKLYTTSSTYANHLKTHDSRYPTACSFPDCHDENLWPKAAALSRHLPIAHGLTTLEERLPYLPASIKKRGRKRPPADTQEQEPESSKTKKSRV